MSTEEVNAVTKAWPAYLLLVIPNVDLSVVQAHQKPRLGGMEIDALDTIGARTQCLLDLQLQHLKPRQCSHEYVLEAKRNRNCTIAGFLWDSTRYY